MTRENGDKRAVIFTFAQKVENNNNQDALRRTGPVNTSSGPKICIWKHLKNRHSRGSNLISTTKFHNKTRSEVGDLGFLDRWLKSRRSPMTGE